MKNRLECDFLDLHLRNGSRSTPAVNSTYRLCFPDNAIWLWGRTRGTTGWGGGAPTFTPGKNGSFSPNRSYQRPYMLLGLVVLT